MAPGERAERLALMLLKELMGITHHTDDDDLRMQALVLQASEAAKEAGVTLRDLLTITVHQLEDAEPALFERFKAFATRVSAA